MTLKGHPGSALAADAVRATMVDTLANRPDIAEKLIPDWPVSDFVALFPWQSTDPLGFRSPVVVSIRHQVTFELFNKIMSVTLYDTSPGDQTDLIDA